jgi:hypothetical protein
MAKLSTYLAKLTKRVATLFFNIFMHFFLKITQKCANNYQKSTGELINWLFFEFLPKKLAKILIIAIFGAISGQFLAISMVNTPQIGGNY